MRVTETLTISVFGVLSVSVSVSPPSGYIGDSITCDASWDAGAIGPFNIAIAWGDGQFTNVSGHQNKSISRNHIYGSSGNYTVTVNVEDSYTAALDSGTDSVEIRNPVFIDLSADKASGDVPLMVNFTCAMSGGYPPYDWSLDFGDGTAPASGQQASPGEVFPSHTYSVFGTYTAVLTVTDGLGVTVIQRKGIRAGAVAFPVQIIHILAPMATGLIIIKISK